MGLRRVDFTPLDGRLPDRARILLQAANDASEAFITDRLDQPIAAFVPSDYEEVYRALGAIAESFLSPGRCFCEWGSGLGIVSSFAASLGFDAHGIEIERELVEEARRLAKLWKVSVDFVWGSFVPTRAQSLVDETSHSDSIAWLAPGGQDGHDLLGHDPDDWDIVFAYPWPGEEEIVEEIFDRHGARGALLLTYRGREGVWLQRRG